MISAATNPKMSTAIRVTLTTVLIHFLLAILPGCPNPLLAEEAGFRIALAQTTSTPDKEANLEKIRSFSARATDQGAQIICFPELSVSGYDLREAAQRAEPIPGPSSHVLSAMARELGITILAGMAEREGAHLYITQVAAFPRGRVEIYRKTHPGRRERQVFSQGDRLPVFQTEDRRGRTVTFAVGICYDLHFPGLAQAYSLGGAQILFAPHASPVAAPQRLALWNRYLGTRAYDHTLYVAANNHLTLLKGKRSGGGAGVWGPATAVPMAQTTEVREGILFCDLDLEALAKRRAPHGKTFFTKDIRPGLYYKESRLPKPSLPVYNGDRDHYPLKPPINLGPSLN